MSVTVKVTVDDKELRRLISATKGSVTRIVADGVEYGIYQELGHHDVAARPCAVPAVEKVRIGFGKAFQGAITLVQVEKVVEKAARDVERLWKQYIVTKKVVVTGAYLNSIHVVK